MVARRWEIETERKIAQAYEDGLNSKQLGRQYEASPSVILDVCRRQGVAIRKPGMPRTREAHPRWKGGIRESGKGYQLKWVEKDDPLAVMIHAGGQYIPLHRYVVASALGRPLRRDESVHHINGDPRDNRLENLQLRATVSHGQGQARQCGDCGSRNVVCVEI